MKGKDLASLAKLDEERMLREMQAKEAREDRKAAIDMKNFSNKKRDNLEALRRQMMEKEQQRKLEKMENDAYANLIRQKVVEGELQDRAAQEAYRAQQKRNGSNLEKQIMELQ